VSGGAARSAPDPAHRVDCDQEHCFTDRRDGHRQVMHVPIGIVVFFMILLAIAIVR
jgi:hypothetical protein